MLRKFPLLARLGLLAAFGPLASQAATQTFNYTGAAQSFVVPAGVTSVTITASGAAGGTGAPTSKAGGLGGTTTGTIAVTPGETLAIYVGGAGGPGAGTGPGGIPVAAGTAGFNGGGAGGQSGSFGSGGGGGASDVRQGGSALGNRVLVAGGGGGAGSNGGIGGAGGHGGAATGQSGADSNAAGTGGAGGSPTSGGAGGTAFGVDAISGGAGSAGAGGAGGTGVSANGGGGGAGYYGGGGGGGARSAAGGGAGGGSSYAIPSATGGSSAQGNRAGHGQVVLAWRAASITVSTDAELRAALLDQQAGDTITFGADITLASKLPPIGQSLTIDGAGHTLNGANLYRLLFVQGGTVTIRSLHLANGRATGGNGGTGNGGGGGGLGAGGALFVSAGDVTLDGVTFANCAAMGGNGGQDVQGGVPGGAGGGGLDFPGINAGTGVGGASGGAGGGPFPGLGGLAETSDDSGNNTAGTDGGDLSGGGGGGGNHGGLSNSYGKGGGAGGFGGGGGGAGVTSRNESAPVPGAGNGGFGGGGGGSNGNLPVGQGGFGGGLGGHYRQTAGGGWGGGGAGLGGAIFVREGAHLTLTGSGAMSAGLVAGGAGGGANSVSSSASQPGSAFGSGVFLQGLGTTLTLAPGVGETQTIADVIADVAGNGGGSGITANLAKTGLGTLVLSGANTIAGDISLQAGTLRVDGALPNASHMLVSSGATLGGSGTIAGKTVLDGILSADDGLLTLGALDWNPGASLQATIGGSVANPVTVDLFGKGIGTGAFTIALTDGGVLPSQTYTLLTFSSVTGFTAADFTVTGIQGSLSLAADALRFTVAALPVYGVSVTVAKGKNSATFTITNTGNTATTFRVLPGALVTGGKKGPKPPPGTKPTKVTYKVIYTLNGADISSAVATGTADTASVAPGASVQVIVKLKVLKKVDFKRKVRADLLAISGASPSTSAKASAAFTIKAGQK